MRIYETYVLIDDDLCMPVKIVNYQTKHKSERKNAKWTACHYPHVEGDLTGRWRSGRGNNEQSSVYQRDAHPIFHILLEVVFVEEIIQQVLFNVSGVTTEVHQASV